MDAGLLSLLELGLRAVHQPPPGVFFVVETDGPDGPCWVTITTDFGTRSVFAQEAAFRLFMDVELVFHGCEDSSFFACKNNGKKAKQQ
jgi:hypothetical protein